MDSDRLFSVLVGALLLAGIGASATTLRSSVDTTPDDVIDVDSASLPLSPDDVGEYAARLDSNSRGGAASGDSGEPRRPNGGGGKADDASDRGGANAGGDQSEQAAVPHRGDRTAHERKRDSGARPHRDEQSLLEWLLSLLRAILTALLRALPLLLALGLIAVAVARRDRIAAFLAERFGGDDATDESGDPPLRAAPENDVTRAWYEMAALVDGDGVETTSPRECAGRAVAAGADRSAVERVTEAFEEVRYGHAEVTPERRERALDALDSVRSQLGVSR